MNEISFEEMRDALKQIARFCLQYEDSLHRDFFKDLYERIRTVTTDGRASADAVRSAYQDAIGALVRVSDPPSRDTIDAVYAQLKEVSAQSLSISSDFRVEISMNGVEEGEAGDVERSLFEGDLRANLPQRRLLDGHSRSLLQEFRSQLPASDPLFREQAGNGEGGDG